MREPIEAYFSPAPAAGAADVSVPRPARRVAWLLLVTTVFVVPLAMSNLTALGLPPLTYDGSFIVKACLLGLLISASLCAWCVDALLNGGEVRHSPLGWLVLALIVWAGLCTAFAVNVPTALLGAYGRYDGLLAIVGYGAVFFLVLQLVDTSGRARTLALSLTTSAAIVSAYGLAQYLGHDPTTWGSLGFEATRAFATFGNPDLLGGLLVLCLPIAVGLAISEEFLWIRAAAWTAFAFEAACLIATFARGSWIGAVVGLAVFTIVAWRCGVRLRAFDFAALSVAAVASATIVARSLRSPGSAVNAGARLATLLDTTAGSGRTRTEILAAGARAVKASPLIGYGPDTFALVYPRFELSQYVRDAGYQGIVDNAHSYPLQLAAGVGLPGVVLVYAIFALGAWRSAALVFGRASGPERVVTGAFWAGAAGVLVQLLFGISTPAVTFLLWLCLAVVLAPTASVRTFAAPRWRHAGVAAAVIAALLVSFALGSALEADHEHLLAQGAQGAAQVAHAQAAVRLDPLSARYRKALALAYVGEFASAVDAFDAPRTKGAQASALARTLSERFAAAESELRHARDFAPSDFETYIFLAGLYNDAGERLGAAHYREAVAAARDGLRLAPVAPQLHLQLGYALQGRGDDAQAAAEFQRAVRLDPAYEEAGAALAALRRGSGSERH